MNNVASLQSLMLPKAYNLRDLDLHMTLSVIVAFALAFLFYLPWVLAGWLVGLATLSQ